MKKISLLTIVFCLFCLSGFSQTSIGINSSFGIGLNNYGYGFHINHNFKENINLEFHPSVTFFNLNDDNIKNTSLDFDFHYLFQVFPSFEYFSVYPILGFNYNFIKYTGKYDYNGKTESGILIRDIDYYDSPSNKFGLNYGVGAKLDWGKIIFNLEYKYNLIMVYSQSKVSMGIAYKF